MQPENSPTSTSEERISLVKAALQGFQADDIERILVVGSTARGNARPDSDIDIFCVTKDGKALRTAERFIKIIGDKLPGVEINIGGGSREQAAYFASRRNKNAEAPAWDSVWSSEDAEPIDALIKNSLSKK